MILKLTLNKKWFDMILSGDKVTEYRELKPYWVRRLFDWREVAVSPEHFLAALIEKKYPMFLYAKRITKIQFFNGAHFSDKLPHFTVDYTGMQIGQGVEDWGAEKGKEYLCLSFSNVHDRFNC